MSYLNRSHDPRRRSAAIFGVVAIHALLAVALLEGLDVNFERIVDTRIGATNIKLDPPPPPPPPKPNEQRQKPETYITAPTPPIAPIVIDPVEIARDPVLDQRPFVVDPRPVADPIREPVRAVFTPRKARPSNDPQRWISTDDYPARALRAEAEGVASYRLIVGTSGRVSACEVTRSTGNGLLDDATCDFITRRARFEPATDDSGAKVVGAFTGSVKWEIPE
jgi:periplasmic protein TonB